MGPRRTSSSSINPKYQENLHLNHYKFLKANNLFYYYENNNYECLDSWYSKSSLIIKFSDVYERSKAMDLVGKLIEINISDAPLLPDGEYYHHEIVGVEVWTNTGLYVGSISEILDTGSNDVYVVESETGELLIPAIPDVIESFNVDTGKAVISPIKGLL